MWDAHLTRKSLMFAKSFRWLKAKFAICIGFYNFISPHERLSRGVDRVFRPNTPAMAAGIIDNQRIEIRGRFDEDAFFIRCW